MIQRIFTSLFLLQTVVYSAHTGPASPRQDLSEALELLNRRSSNRSSKKTTQGLLACPICVEGYDSHKRTPMLEKCGNSFCNKCANDLRRRAEATGMNPVCPFCRGGLETKKNTPILKILQEVAVIQAKDPSVGCWHIGVYVHMYRIAYRVLCVHVYIRIRTCIYTYRIYIYIHIAH
jgi:hypothetical protein